MPRPNVSDQRREEILAAFEACVVRKGIASTTLSDVAHAANQARSLVRYFIGNREDMVTCLIDRILERSEKNLKALGKQKPAELVDLLLDQVFADHSTNIIMVELWQLALRDEVLRARLVSIYGRIVEEIAVNLCSNSSNDEVKAVQYDAAFATVSTAIGVAFFRQLGLPVNDSTSLRLRMAKIVVEPSVKLKQ